MTPPASDVGPMHSPKPAPQGRRAAEPASRGVPPGIVAQRLVGVPWRHAGLIAACALAGAMATTRFWPHPPPVHLAAARPRGPAIDDAPSPSGAGVALRLDVEPGASVVHSGATQAADAALASSAMLQLDAASHADGIDAVLRDAPPGAGPLPGASELAPAGDGRHPDTTLPGLVAGLLLGLSLAGARELRGERLRSPREAEWALGAPVLGAIPTLSAKAREALLEARRAARDAA